MTGLNAQFLQKRLVDYVIFVGVRKPTLDSSETPELLRRFPQKDHDDFPLPADIVFFCQPEGCNTVSKKFSLREANSFVFTLTEKDSGKVRYGVCVNIYRPCVNFLHKEGSETKDSAGIKRKRSKSMRNKREMCMTLTSICLVSHHPFFSTFRECLFFLRKMIDSRVGRDSYDKNDNLIPGLDSWSVFTCTEDQKTSPLAEDMAEVETWIQRLLLAPAPLPGRTKVEVELLCPNLYPPLTFAMPESHRFPLIDFPVHIPLELLGVETCLKVLTCILLEHKVSGFIFLLFISRLLCAIFCTKSAHQWKNSQQNLFNCNTCVTHTKIIWGRYCLEFYRRKCIKRFCMGREAIFKME